MPYSIASDWVLKFTASRVAEKDATSRLGFTPIKAIEPDAVFTKRTIGIYATSEKANPNWYPIGYLMQGYLVGFGSAGYAEGETIKIIQNRYHIHQFNMLPHLANETQYRLSFSPLYYYPDVKIQVWEYIGTNQSVSNEDLQQTIEQVNQRVAKTLTTSTQSLAILKKLQGKNK